MTPEQLGLIMPMSGNRDAWSHLLTVEMDRAEINTVIRAAAFIAQAAHECNELRSLVELTGGQIYDGRADLGNTRPGDGPRFKGRGIFQLTGRANYHAASLVVGIDLEANPEQAADPQVSVKTAVWYWQSRGLSALADVFDFRGITRRINGGYNGLLERTDYYHRALEVFGRDAKVV